MTMFDFFKNKRQLEQLNEEVCKNLTFQGSVPLDLVDNIKPKDISRDRIEIIRKLFSLAFCFIVIMLFYRVQIFTKDTKVLKNNENPFYRPDIVDRNGEVITTNFPMMDLFVEPKNVVDAERSAKALVKILPKLDYEEVLTKMKSGKNFSYLKRQITPTEQERIWLIGEPGFGFKKNEGRVYPSGTLFAHVVGNVDIDNNGVSGIEKWIDEHKLNKSKESVELSVDMYIQDAIRQNLIKAMDEYGAKSAGGIVMDVKTGEILGLVSLPDFKNNDYKKTVFNSLYNNHVTLDVYEVGSVMKIFNTALAIENNYPNDKIFDVSKIFKIGNHRVKDSHPKKWLLNMTEGFIYSSNIVMANIAIELGVEKQKEFFQKLNMLKKMEFELPERGLTIYPKDWNETNGASIGYGYSMSPTMLHVVAAVNAIVNDGMYVAPTLIKRKKDSLLKSVQVVSPATSEAMRKLMRLVITDGTGYMAKMKDIRVGGKTGTSYKIINGAYDNSKTRTFFVSIFPAESPKYTMLIMLDEANNKGCNSSACTAVPVSSNIIKEITSILNLDLRL